MKMALNKILRGLMKEHLPADTLAAGHVTLPNGLRMCWGHKADLKNGDAIQLPVTFGRGAVAFMEPRYNTGTTMDCSFSTTVTGNQLKLDTYDHQTTTTSESTTLSVRFFVIGGGHCKRVTSTLLSVLRRGCFA